MKNLFLINKKLITLSTAILEYYRSWSMRFASRTLSELLGSMNNFLAELGSSHLADYSGDILSILQTILSAQENEDNVLLADIIEINLIPSLNTIQQTIIQCEPDISFENLSDDRYNKNIAALNNKHLSGLIRRSTTPNISVNSSISYSVEPSTVGANIIKYADTTHSFYLHSNNNPFDEGNIWAKTFGEENYFNYTVLGFGMGYHIRALLEYDRRFEVTVIETNIQVLSLAFTYEDISDILSNPRFHLVYEPDITQITKTLNNNITKFIIHYPSMMALPEGAVKSAIKQYFIKLDSMHSHSKYLKWNFYYNAKHQHPSVDTIKNAFSDKTVILLAGGPSLEKSVDFLKNLNPVDDSYVLLSVGTAYRGLVNNGIIPDFVIISDAGDRIFYQLKDIPESNTSLIYLSTASDKAVNTFNGKKYIACQNGYEEAEKLADANGYTLFETGGSVSTTAIDIALRLGCKKLITLGLDLGYPDNKLHSFRDNYLSVTDTSAANIPAVNVPSVTGRTIPSTNVLTIYRKWIEERFEQEIKSKSNIEIINISNGAYINNAKNLPTDSLKNFKL